MSGLAGSHQNSGQAGPRVRKLGLNLNPSLILGVFGPWVGRWAGPRASPVGLDLAFGLFFLIFSTKIILFFTKKRHWASAGINLEWALSRPIDRASK